MSTRCTIGYGDKYHLFEECFDSDRVWIQLEGKSFELDHRTMEERLVVGIDVTVWRKIVEAWNNSHWGKHPERDHVKEEIDDEHLEWLSKVFAKKKDDSNG